MPKNVSAGFKEAKNRLDQSSPWIELYSVEITSTETIYLTNHTTPVLYGGKEYTPYPIQHEAIRDETGGRLQRFTIHVANVVREAQYYLERYSGLRGKKVSITWVNLDDLSLGVIQQTYTIDSTTATDEATSFVLGKVIPIMDVRLPGRMITRDLFPAVPL